MQGAWYGFATHRDLRAPRPALSCGMQALLEIVRRLRAPDGCPWDRRQTHATLRPYLLEEAAEAADALAFDEPAEAAAELGDVLLQVALHAVIAEEQGEYDYDAIEDAVVRKMVHRHPHVFAGARAGDHRHPHVFAGARAEDEAAVVRRWEELKAAERGGDQRPPEHRVPRSLPALARAARLGEAFEWEPDAGTEGWTVRQIAERPERLGPALLALARVAQRAGIDPELALRDHLEARLEREAAEAGA